MFRPLDIRPVVLLLMRFAALCPMLVAAAFGAPSFAAETPADLRSTLFGAADRALEAANALQAGLLAPAAYGDGAESYRRAQAILESGGGIESIQRHLTRAQADFATAATVAAEARQAFGGALEAHNDAASAEADRFAPEAWQAAQESMVDAARRLERGRRDSALRQGEAAEAQYRAAELAAIQGNYLHGTRSLLATADELRASRYAPRSYERAQALLEQAETSLSNDRYDTDRPRNLAQQAEHNAHHAIYVSRLEQQIRDDDTDLEAVLLGWEGSVAAVADELDVPVYFDTGHETAAARLTEAVQNLKADISFLEQGVADRDAQIASLELELGGQSQSLARVNQALAQRERQTRRFERVEDQFTPEEATVLRQSDSVILRLIGLKFASASARLGTDQQALLMKVQTALGEFPEAGIVIEGHTDSFGSDEDNQGLSQARADTVLQYLLTNSPRSPADLRAEGFGESRPVANNETAEGRARNRRIDIVIHPRW